MTFSNKEDLPVSFNSSTKFANELVLLIVSLLISDITSPINKLEFSFSMLLLQPLCYD